MKIIWLVFVVLFTSINSEASLDVANKVWRDFRSCAKRSPDDVLFTCAKNYLASSLVPPEKSHLARFLDMDYDFTPLQECTAANKIQPTKKTAGECYCMEIKKKKNGQGYVVFVKESESLKIESIKFSY